VAYLTKEIADRCRFGCAVGMVASSTKAARSSGYGLPVTWWRWICRLCELGGAVTSPDLACGAVFHLAGVHPGPDLQAKVERLQEQLAAAMDVAQAALQAAYAMPVKDSCDGCHGIKEAAILAALQRIRLCEAAAEVLDACLRPVDRRRGGLMVTGTGAAWIILPAAAQHRGDRRVAAL
jgi:hypothetical protein